MSNLISGIEEEGDAAVTAPAAASTPVTFRTSLSKLEQIDRIAQTLERNRNWLINSALDALLDHHKWQMNRLAQARQEAREGKGAPVADVREDIRKRKESRIRR